MILTVTANPAIDKVYFFDEFVMGEVHRPKKITVSAGGKGINVSKVAHTLGEAVIATGFVGGNAGEFIIKETENYGITAAYTIVNGETRTNVNISDNSGRSGEILEPGPEITKKDVDAYFTQFDTFIDKFDIVCASGSLPKGLDASFYTEIIRRCKAKNKPVIADTSGNAMLTVMNEAPFMMKPNRDELAQLIGYTPKDQNDIIKALFILKEKGIGLPLVTMGKDGAFAIIDNRCYHFSSPAVAVKNAVGSGDSTVAGIATGICRGMSLFDAIRLGMASGTANTQFHQTGMVSADLVEKYFKEVSFSAVF